jgi:Reverse transcriptase (RNA-dependent DNA polymerase)
LLKKPSLDASNDNNCRPVSNLSFLSKTIGRLVDARLVNYADKNQLFPAYQSAYRAHHSTETALVHLYNEVVLAIDNGEVGELALLEMSAAFDTIDHDIMLNILRRRVSVQVAALEWFASSFTDRIQVVVSGRETCPRCSACDVDVTAEHILLHCASFAIARDHSFNMTVTTLSELFSKVPSRSIIEFIKKTGLYRKI